MLVIAVTLMSPKRKNTVSTGVCSIVNLVDYPAYVFSFDDCDPKEKLT